MAHLQIDFPGEATDDFCDSLAQQGIEYEDATPRPEPGVIYASAGEILAIIGDAVPWAALAAVITSWLRANSRRKVIITTRDNQVVHVEGMSTEDLERVLKIAKRATLLEVPSKKSKK